MDEMLAKLERLYPNSGYVRIKEYNPNDWINKDYDSSFDSKGALNRWRTNPMTYQEAQEAVSNGYRVGWVIPKGLVVVDVDNGDNEGSSVFIEKILKKFEVAYSYNYTSKGTHFLFKDDTNEMKSVVKYKCSLNVEIDTRANETGYIVLPCNDPHREWGEWKDGIEDIPYFLKPLTKDATPSFIGMTEGDGRNDALYRWRFKLEKAAMSASEVEKSIRIINENLFEIPISNAELFKTVLREQDTKIEKEEQDNRLNAIADRILSKHDLIFYSGRFYMFNGKYYKECDDLEIERVIHYEISQNITSNQRKEIISFLKLKSFVDTSVVNKDWFKIACDNGVLNLVNGEVELPNKNEINTIYVPYEYDSNPEYSPRIDEFMKELTDGDVIKMNFLYQIAGYCLLKKNIFEKFVICRGEGGTGKSTYMNLLHRLVGGDANCSHVSLPDFDKDYYLATMTNKLLNIDDDVVDGKLLSNTGKFKSLISGNIISVRNIYQAVSTFVPFCTCIFSCNRLPSISDKTTGLYRRMILIELNKKVKHPDPTFMTKVTYQDMQYFMFKAVEGIKKAIEEGHFAITQSENMLLEKFKRRQSPLSEWLFTCGFTLGDVVKSSCRSLYAQFSAWATENGYSKILTSYSFKDDMCLLFDVEIDKVEENGMMMQKFVKRGEDVDLTYTPFGKD